jgi:DNA polymerase V
MVALIDCNNFYVSCERVFRPDLIGKPVVVLSNNDGCIISRSEEAKSLGLKMAEPAFHKREFMQKHGVVAFSSNYVLYGDMSQRVHDTLRQISPELEIYSIDECFAGLSGIPVAELLGLGKRMKQVVTGNTGIPVSVGIAPTKTLSKIANKIAKKTPEKNGICLLITEREIDQAIRNTPVEDIWGIGRQYAQLLIRYGMRTAWDFTRMNNNWIKKNMSVVGVRTKEELLGKSCLSLEMVQSGKKAIATTRAFGKKTADPAILFEAISAYTARCAEKLRKQHSTACVLTVFIHTDPFNPKEKQYNASKTIKLPVSTNSHLELVRYARICLRKLYRRGYLYKKAGVIVSGLESEHIPQYRLFDEVDRKKQARLLQANDKINQIYGRDTVKLAVQGNGQQWKLRQEKLSRCYTTRLSDIIRVCAG